MEPLWLVLRRGSDRLVPGHRAAPDGLRAAPVPEGPEHQLGPAVAATTALSRWMLISAARGEWQCWEAAAGSRASRSGSCRGGGPCPALLLSPKTKNGWESSGTAWSPHGMAWAWQQWGKADRSLLQLTGAFWFLPADCKELIRWCLSLHSLDRPSLEDLSCDPWLQDSHHP